MLPQASLAKFTKLEKNICVMRHCRTTASTKRALLMRYCEESKVTENGRKHRIRVLDKMSASSAHRLDQGRTAVCVTGMRAGRERKELRRRKRNPAITGSRQKAAQKEEDEDRIVSGFQIFEYSCDYHSGHECNCKLSKLRPNELVASGLPAPNLHVNRF